MTRHVSQRMQRIKRIGDTLSNMSDYMYATARESQGIPTGATLDGLTREAVQEVIDATPDERRESAWHCALPDRQASDLADDAEHVADWWRGNMDLFDPSADDPVDIRKVRTVVCDGVSEFSALYFETPDGWPVRLGDTWDDIKADDPDDPFQDPVDGIYGDDEDYWRWAADDRLAEHDVHLGRYHADGAGYGGWYELEPHAMDTPKGPLTVMTLHDLDLALTDVLPEGYETRVILEGTDDERIDVTQTGHDGGLYVAWDAPGAILHAWPYDDVFADLDFNNEDTAVWHTRDKNVTIQTVAEGIRICFGDIPDDTEHGPGIHTPDTTTPGISI